MQIFMKIRTSLLSGTETKSIVEKNNKEENHLAKIFDCYISKFNHLLVAGE